MDGWMDRLVHGDALEVLPQLPAASVDLVLTDPPYFRVMAEEWDNQWPDVGAFAEWVGRVARELRRVLKPNGALYWFGDDKSIAYCQVELDREFRLLNSLVWRKPTTQAARGIDRLLRSFAINTERCLYYEMKGVGALPAAGLDAMHSSPECFVGIKEYMRAEKAKLKAARGLANDREFAELMRELTGTSSVVARHYFADSQWQFPTAENYAALQGTGFWRRSYEGLRADYEQERAMLERELRVWNNHPAAFEVLECVQTRAEYHPTQKPVELIGYLLERASRPGAVVLDPFAGSGTTAVACHRAGRHYVCIERCREYFERSVERLDAERAQGLLALGC